MLICFLCIRIGELRMEGLLLKNATLKPQCLSLA